MFLDQQAQKLEQSHPKIVSCIIFVYCFVISKNIFNNFSGFKKTYRPSKSFYEIQSAKVRALIEYRKIHPKNEVIDEENEEDRK